ncbi:gamma-glutamyltranspeptidase/glutathione hydrolase [Sphingopyxis panaciterrae]|uniref:gamma-glutamyltransferase n=1 Tax=Sphingopyxis panaciterrae TaxID=363841 RepID=UPI00141EA96C|nr:gamma-glutamyltransferase [Sphingopyxis panaciterrae]NIJ35650.1 gamma-glutamyltranspeptidase/glutathione hydrolase [Sphingopyxis panaciterrae]
MTEAPNNEAGSGTETLSPAGTADAPATLAPSGWPAADRERFWRIQQDSLPGNPAGRGHGGAVSTALNGFAARVGEEALRQGGSAVDAVLSAALAQIVLGGGAVISFFGIMALMHVDGESGEVTSLNAGWNTVQGEDDPLSIPGTLNAAGDGIANMMGTGEPSGRTALVGGFMRGLEAAHRRHGKLPFARLFEAAIELADDGFIVSPGLARYIDIRKQDLARLPETKAVFFKPDDTPYAEGDHFRQPALAETLRRIAAEGADYMYSGAWAAKCIEAIQADGGRMTLDDLAAYQPVWSDPVTIERRDHSIALLGEPCEGSVNLVETLNLCEVAGIRERGHWSTSADSLIRLAKCCAAIGGMRYETEEEQAAAFPGLDMGRTARLGKAHARDLWARLEEQSPIRFLPKGTHSDVVVAVDADGNMAALCHSINCLIWGRTAIVVDGVSVGDPAAYMQTLVAATPRGGQLPNPIEVGIILKDGKADTAWSSMGVGLHYQTTQSLLNIVDFGMDLEQTANAPRLLLPISPDASQRELILRVIDGEFSDEVLDATGLEIKRLQPVEARFAQGLWVAIRRDQTTGELTAISPTYTNGQATAF